MQAIETIKNLIETHPVILFMKGDKLNPQCGFSARVVQILDFLKIKYEVFDVLSSDEVRQAIKDYSSWPTIPQLYVNKEFIGGCDIIQEQFQTGELEKSLKNFTITENQSSD